MSSHYGNTLNLPKGKIAVILLATYFLIMMDTSITMTALNNIQIDFNLSDGTLTWVQSAYVLTFGGFLLIGSKLSDNYGFKNIFLLGNIIFLIFSILSGLAINSSLLILSRGGQGLGAALISPTILGIINSIFKDNHKRKQIISYYSAVAGIGVSVGLILGGILITFISWRVCFLINIPLCITFILYAHKIFPKLNNTKSKPIDILGGIISVIAILILMFGLEQMNTTINTTNISLIIISLILLVIFVIIEKRKHTPLVELRLFKNSIRTSGYILRLLFVGANFSLWYYLSLYFQKTYHLSPLVTGLVMVSLTACNFIVAINIHKKIQKSSDLVVLIQGLIFSIIGMLMLLGTLTYQLNILYFLVPLAFIGIGQGFAFSPLTNLGMHNVTNEHTGMASGLVNFSHQIGASSGIVVELILSNLIIHFFKLQNDTHIFTILTVCVGLLILILMFITTIVLNIKNNKI